MIRNPFANVATSSGVTLGKDDKARQPKDKKAPDHLMANKEQYSNMETQEPYPAGFKE
ncbi:hypothetical protein SLEP1_g2722 [Rubroshorea leprosula]|uniref:Uncharacterized protein n=1 Tax=Rubroshorea leprosula TaxID=152421 RepID=A0AAV5HQD7_9ROSI|nr:hypothetical protein SLEP1_g2722 [Rubroshorea leprosula]